MGGITPDDSSYKYTSQNHPHANVPVYAVGYGTQIFNDKEVDNTDISKFCAWAYGRWQLGRQLLISEN